MPAPDHVLLVYARAIVNADKALARDQHNRAMLADVDPDNVMLGEYDAMIRVQETTLRGLVRLFGIAEESVRTEDGQVIRAYQIVNDHEEIA
jgi:hypothetical protein